MKLMIKTGLFIVTVFFLLQVNAWASVVVWQEDFSDEANHATEGAQADIWGSVVTWETLPKPANNGTGGFEVNGDTIRGMYLDGVATWQTSGITISGYTDVGISVDLYTDGNFSGEGDYLDVYYSYDNQSFTFIGGLTGAGSATVSISGLAGDLLFLKVEGDNDHSSEKYRFDNVTVTAEVEEDLETVPVPSAVFILGAGLFCLVGVRKKVS